MSCNPQDLMDAARCIQCAQLTWHQAAAIRVRLLCAILAGEKMSACDPTTLLEASNCLMCLGTGALQAIEISLLCQIAAGGISGGGSGGVLSGSGSPEGVVTATSASSVYYDPATGAFWVFNGVAGAKTGWVNVIAP